MAYPVLAEVGNASLVAGQDMLHAIRMGISGCPCGGDHYAACCGPLHAGVRDAATASELMRSRYSAYAVGALDYVFRTWHPRTRPDSIEPNGLRWTGLCLVDAEDGGVDDQVGVVEFVASFIDRGRPGELCERSFFERRRGRWVYVEADVNGTRA